jgi:hypothetical protein
MKQGQALGLKRNSCRRAPAADIERLVRASERIEPAERSSQPWNRCFGVRRQLTELEQQVIVDAKSAWNEPLAERLRAEIRHRFLHGK